MTIKKTRVRQRVRFFLNLSVIRFVEYSIARIFQPTLTDLIRCLLFFPLVPGHVVAHLNRSANLNCCGR